MPKSIPGQMEGAVNNFQTTSDGLSFLIPLDVEYVDDENDGHGIREYYIDSGTNKCYTRTEILRDPFLQNTWRINFRPLARETVRERQQYRMNFVVTDLIT